jgi:pseudouridine-5'-phosphate glycosidase
VQLSPEVQAALERGGPVVALESTIISHGMPYPRNLEVARQVEEAVRSCGAVPATIAVIDGIPRAGLSEAHMLALSNQKGSVLKASTRDLGNALARGLTAATTVAATMKLAHLAGIAVFATGGIGGVHRGSESTMDVSADLLELSRTPVTVVCAGIKSILDIPKSLEVLESNSVPVVSLSSPEFPAFYTNNSGVKSPLSLESTGEIACIMLQQRRLQLGAGVLVAVPNPEPASAERIQSAINHALAGAKSEGIKGAAVTPYLLNKIQQLTEGASLDSNIALVLNNARVAAKIAVEYAALVQAQAQAQPQSSSADSTEHIGISLEEVRSGSSGSSDSSSSGSGNGGNSSSGSDSSISSISSDSSGSSSSDSTAPASLHTDVLVVGGAVVDIIGHITTPTKYQTSNPGRINTSHGGVGRNIAHSLARLGTSVSLATAVADDANGDSLRAAGQRLGLDMSLVKVLQSAPKLASQGQGQGEEAHSTAVYSCIHDNAGDLAIGIADMSIFGQINAHYVKTLAPAIRRSPLVVVDGNISAEAFSTLGNMCSHFNTAIFFEVPQEPPQ